MDRPIGASSAYEAVARLRALLDVSFATLPKLSFLLSTVPMVNATRCINYPRAPTHPPPCPLGMPSAITSFNALLPAVVAEYVAYGHDVRLHDLNAEAQFVAADYWVWGIHFNASGHEKIATAWHGALRSLSRRGA